MNEMTGQKLQFEPNGRKFFEIEQFLENTPDAIIAVDEKGLVTIFNRQSEVILKYIAKDTLGLPVSQFYADGFAMAQKVKTLLLNSPNGKLTGLETAVLSTDGEVIPILLWAMLLSDEQGKPAGSIGYFRDLRELQEIERLNHALLANAQATQVLEKMVITLAEIFHAQASILALYDHRDDALRIAESAGISGKIKDKILCKSGEGAIGKVFETNEPMHGLITKKEREEELAFACLSEHILIHSFVAIPLAYRTRYGQETFGVVLLLNKMKDGVADEYGFSWIDKARLNALAGQIVGLVQRDLHRESLRALLEVGTELAAIHQIDDILQKIAAVLVDILGYRAAYFRLVRADKKLVVRAEKGLRSVKSFYTTDSEMGIVGRAISEKRIIALYDLLKLPDDYQYYHPDVMKTEGWRGMLAVPVMSEEKRVLGVLVCYTGRPHWFTENETCLVNTFANLAAVALNNAFHFENQEKEQELLASTIQVIQQSKESNENRAHWRELLQAAMQITGADYGSISIVDRLQGKIVPLWYQPYPENNQVVEHEIDGHSIISKVAREGEGQLIADVSQTQWKEDYYQARPETKSELALPLYDYVSNKVAGVLNLESPEVGGFDEHHHRILESLIGIYASNIIHNPDQTERWNQMRSREEALHKASEAFSRAQFSGLSEGEIFRGIIDQAVSVTNAKYGSLLLAEEDKLAIVATYPPERLGSMNYEQTHYPLNGPGITVQVFNQQRSQIVDDVYKVPIFIDTTHDTRSLLAVFLQDFDGNPIGVLNLEDPRISHFSPHDEHTLKIFGLLTIITRRFLDQAKDLTAAQHREDQLRTFTRAIRNIGMKSHNLSSDVRVVTGRLNRLKGLIRDKASEAVVEEELDKIIYASGEILREATENWEDLTKRLESSSLESLVMVPFLEKLAASWRTHPKYSRIEIILKSSLPAATTIQAQETEFIDVLETLISNSARALSNLPDGRKPIIQIQAQLVDNKCELIFEDNGSGIPTELLTELGEIPVVGQETGIGAWLAAATIRNDMQGTIEWQNIAPYGTQVKICLSALQQEHQLDGEDEYHETTSDSLL